MECVPSLNDVLPHTNLASAFWLFLVVSFTYCFQDVIFLKKDRRIGTSQCHFSFGRLHVSVRSRSVDSQKMLIFASQITVTYSPNSTTVSLI